MGFYRQRLTILDRILGLVTFRDPAAMLEPDSLGAGTGEPSPWPDHHPLYWLQKAEDGDANAMTRLALIYDRGGDVERC